MVTHTTAQHALDLNERRSFNATILPSVWPVSSSFTPFAITECRRRLFAVDEGGRCCKLRWSLSKLLLHSQKMSSQYVGVTFRKAISKWQARLSIQSRTIELGSYKQEAAAAKARDK